jgi:hypothetical protein
LKRRRSILTLGAFLCLVAAGVMILSALGASHAHQWIVQRCGPTAGASYPELVWLIFIGPSAFVGFLSGVATIWAEWSRRGGWASWLLLGLTTLLVIGAATLAVVGRFGACPAAV